MWRLTCKIESSMFGIAHGLKGVRENDGAEKEEGDN
jgi:hypothetical protein